MPGQNGPQRPTRFAPRVTLMVIAGFLLFMVGAMQSKSDFGFLTALALTVAFLADITLVPTLIRVLDRTQVQHPLER